MINDHDKLRERCTATIKSFESVGDSITTPDGVLIYRENPKAKILGVAHLDTVLKPTFKLQKRKKGVRVWSQTLDDRLGVHVLMDVLPCLGIEFDLLLTEGEEQGRSTAAWFESPKSYNWIFSFDRRGKDVVMYEYDSLELRGDLRNSGLTPGYGTFSDICFLNHLGVRGVNVGVGYHGEHTQNCFADLRTTESQVNAFKAFYQKFEDKKYPFDPLESGGMYRDDFPYGGNWHINSRWDYDELYCYLCERRRGRYEITAGKWICDSCVVHADICQSCGDIRFAYELMDGICYDCVPDLGYISEY